MESKIAVALLLAALFLFTPTPVIDSVSPDYGLNNGTVEVIIDGAKFDNQAVVKLMKPGETDLVATDVKIISKKRISCTFDLRDQAVGTWSVTVDNLTKVAKKTKRATLTEGFTIQYPAPTIAVVDPSSGLNSEIVTLNLSGINFRTGAKVELNAPDQKIQANDVKVVTDSRIAAGFDLVGAAPGTYDVKVINDDGKSAMLPGGFEILERQLVKPAISEIIPTEGFNNGPMSTAIHGTNFDPGASVKLVGSEGEEIPGFEIIVKNARELICSFDLDQQTIGSYDVVVLNPNGQEAILSDGFKVIEYTNEERNGLTKPIFFDFDQAEIRGDQVMTIEANLKFLAENPDSYILLGGHADERGTREYNLGLSERRAEAVKEFLLENGIDPSKIMIYAYGEDYPFKKGHDEQSWSYNRRVDLLVGEEPLTQEEGIIGNENISP